VTTTQMHFFLLPRITEWIPSRPWFSRRSAENCVEIIPRLIYGPHILEDFARSLAGEALCLTQAATSKTRFFSRVATTPRRSSAGLRMTKFGVSVFENRTTKEECNGTSSSIWKRRRTGKAGIP